jgi:hypothetical protein
MINGKVIIRIPIKTHPILCMTSLIPLLYRLHNEYRMKTPIMTPILNLIKRDAPKHIPSIIKAEATFFFCKSSLVYKRIIV